MDERTEMFIRWAENTHGSIPSPEFEDAFDGYSRSSGYVLDLPKQTVRDLELEHDRLMYALKQNYKKLIKLKAERRDG